LLKLKEMEVDMWGAENEEPEMSFRHGYQQGAIEHVAGVDDFEVAEATYRAAVAREPRARITLHESAQQG
jgi:hypothetical protein